MYQISNRKGYAVIFSSFRFCFSWIVVVVSDMILSSVRLTCVDDEFAFGYVLDLTGHMEKPTVYGFSVVMLEIEMDAVIRQRLNNDQYVK